MHLTATPATNRVNGAELRFLREAVAATTTECRRAAIQAIVVYAHLHFNMDLTGEAAFLLAEMDADTSQPRLSALN
ncbi:hypothetical protein [Hymenobacter cellulosivorans]|uniref:Uncharacterized protein n=1 Tax=Hymenobacter cellulosivorans TaxID=2932249 RepID=A0ABY4FAN9_9BACT|nr:hypothetical protein [Hymenobacter cellulosivorans]UOQ53087.1 hypothetical protein MUN80_25535 [Hymenobacter cellulosivorans]